MNKLDFIKEFNNIQITKVCKKVNVDYANLISGRASNEAESKVVEELINQINELLRGIK